MVLMALDHASYFVAHVHPGEFWGLALPEYSDALSFLTRFVTHLCAPGFFFLMGISVTMLASSRRQSGWTDSAIRRHLILRGLLLIALQLVVENPAWLLGPLAKAGHLAPGGGDLVLLHFGVLYGLGAAMIVSALLMRLSSTVLIAVSIAAVIMTQILTPDPNKVEVLYSPLARLLLIPGRTGIVQVYYPLVPWLGLAGFGLVFGRWMLNHQAQSSRAAAIIGLAFLALFAVVRLIGGFGNIHPIEGAGWIAFLNVTKYPPSLVFILFTLGVDLLLLALFSQVGDTLETWATPLLVFGRSALFFYLAHLYLYGLIGLAFAPPEGTGIPLMYPFWMAGLLMLYFLCRWYGDFKQQKPADSMWKFF